MCEHEWIVFSTALANVCLMVECHKCHAYGTIDDPTKEEWKEAFYAPSNPHKWQGGDGRVTQRGNLTTASTPTNGERREIEGGKS